MYQICVKAFQLSSQWIPKGHLQDSVMFSSSYKMETQPPFYRIVPKYVLLWNGSNPDPKSETKLKALQTQFSIL